MCQRNSINYLIHLSIASYDNSCFEPRRFSGVRYISDNVSSLLFGDITKSLFCEVCRRNWHRKIQISKIHLRLWTFFFVRHNID